MPDLDVRSGDSVRQYVAEVLAVTLGSLTRAILNVVRTPSPLLRYGAGSEAAWLPYLTVLTPRLFDRLVRRSWSR